MAEQQAQVAYPRLIRRVRAYLFDSVLLVLLFVLWLVSLPALGDSLFLKIAPLVLAILLLEPFLVSFTGGTPGHHIMGLRIRDAGRDEHIGVVRAAVRAIFRVLLGWLSVIFILVTQRHQALHDYFTSTIVVLRRPEGLPAHDRLAVRTEDVARYRYPSKMRRTIVILLYGILSAVALSVVGHFLLSEACLTRNWCSDAEKAALYITDIAWLLGVASVIVLGWRGRLYGARRSRLERDDVATQMRAVD